MNIKIRLDNVEGFKTALKNHPQKCIKALYSTATVSASDLEAKARKNAKWTDRTGQARRSITGSSEANGTTISIKLEGYATNDNKEYFQYLEFAKQKKYAILEPTIEENKDEVINRYAKTFKSINLG